MSLQLLSCLENGQAEVRGWCNSWAKMCAIFHIVRMYLLKLVRFSVSTAFPVWVLFVNVLLDCVFAWFYTDRLG